MPDHAAQGLFVHRSFFGFGFGAKLRGLQGLTPEVRRNKKIGR
jgi:hypothetical protein